MCRLCKIKKAVARNRWPNALASNVNELKILVEQAHSDHVALKEQESLVRRAKQISSSSPSPSKAPLEEPPAMDFVKDGFAALDLEDVKPKSEISQQTEELQAAHNTLVEDVKDLYAASFRVRDARKAWWKSDAAKKKRDGLRKAQDFQKLARLNAINNKCDEMVGEVQGILGSYWRYVLGIDGGLEP